MKTSVSWIEGQWFITWEEPDGSLHGKMFDRKDDAEQFVDWLALMGASHA